MGIRDNLFTISQGGPMIFVSGTTSVDELGNIVGREIHINR
jgi:hypothetical protein